MNNLRSGINVSRRIGVRSNVSDEIRQIRTQGTMPTFQVAVVAEVIYDPKAFSTDDLNALADEVVNPAAVPHMPKNSVLGRVISDSNDQSDPRPRIVYPFFSSHLCLPIKPGEQVWVVYPDPYIDGHEQGYWISRVPEVEIVEDINYTHGDRKYDQSLNPDNQSTSQRANNNNSNSDPPPPNFPNGASTPETLSLFVSGANDRPYDTIFTGSNANLQITYEAVPRFTKRPADFALVGSNNSRIVIGEDRVGPATRVTGSNQTDLSGQAGIIDIVAGVGGIRNFPTSKDDDVLQTNPSKRPTAPQVVQNTRNYIEVDKTTFIRQKQDNPAEGDPDFKRDLSRIYVSMKTKGDKNFGINLGNNNNNSSGIFTGTADKFGTALTDIDAGDNTGQPFIVLKSEHVRIVGTGIDGDNGPSSSGEIRIIKEPTAGKQPSDSPNDFAMISLEGDGKIIQQGKNVYLQINDADNGRIFLGCQDDTTSNADPMVLYTGLKATLDAIIDTHYTFANDVYTALNNLSTNLQGTSAAGPFSPIPKVIAAAIQLVADSITIQTDVQNINNLKSSTSDSANIKSIRSKNIFIKKDGQGES